jgi:hypothetical protein
MPVAPTWAASAECIPANGVVRGNQKIFEGLGA